MKSPCLLRHVWLFCNVMIFAFFFFDEVRGQCMEHHKSVLLKFKHSLVIDEFRVFDYGKSLKLTNWNSSTDCCLWPGVTCSGAYVMGLDLSDEGIVGGFNDSSPLFDLTGLTSLNLSMMHQLTVIPSGIGRLVNLMTLNLSRSYFIGQIPTKVSNLTRLVSLDLSYCAHPNLGMLVGNLSNLIDLRLGSVDLSSQSREWCQVLSSSTPRLQVLDLSNCGLLGPIHDSLQNLTHLSIVDLSDNDFSGPIPYGVFASLEKITSLTLSHNEFNGVFPHTMLQLSSLRYLDISWNDNLEASPSITFRNSSLETLLLHGTRFSKTVPKSIGEASMLSHLDLGRCNLSGQIHKSISQLEHLVYLDLSQNNLDGHIPSFSRSRNLTELWMNYNQLNGSILATDWKKLSQMTTLILSSNSLSGSIPARLFETPSLQILNLGGNHFTGFTGESNITASSSHLVELYLSDNDFQGSFIPPFIGEAKMLSYLDLRFCNLSGQIPKSLSQLEHLVYLDLSHNKLGGHIPSLSRSRNLTVVWMNNNQLRGFTDESNITASSSHLVELYLGHNDFQGSFPPFIYGLNNLQVLDLSFNNFSDTFHFDLLVQVLQGNNFPSAIKKKNFPSFLQLLKLRLASCNLKQFPPFLTNLSILEYLDLSDNQIDGRIPNHIWNMTTLLNLNLSHNRLEFLSREELGGGLEVLDLSSNKLHGKLPNIQKGMRSLLFFSLSSNKLHGSIPVSTCNATSVIVLDFSNNFLSGALPECLVQLPYLTVLNLRNNNISGTIPDTLPSPCVLQTLDLGQNSFQGKIPKSLGRCNSLEALDLGDNKLHDMFPCWMTNVTMLTVLVLKSNSLYDKTQCLNHNYNWSRLQIMDLSSNNFGGELPSRGILSWEAMLVDNNSSSETGDLHYNMSYVLISKGKNILVDLYFRNVVSVIVKGHQRNWTKISTIFTLVDFSDNKFEGDIPHELGELQFLYSLNLSYNYLNGRIPPSFGKLYHIESLDLSNNELSGKIPEQLASLNFLSFLNLSFNHLEGMIPKGRQFQTFTEASFKKNKGLCGQPLNTTCANEGVSSPPNPSSESEDHKFRDIFIATEIGYALGLGLVIMPLIFWSRWREKYYKCIDKVLMNIFYYQPKKSPVSRTIRRRN